MKLCMFSPRGLNLERGWPGRVDGDRVVQLAAQTLQAFFTGGGGAREHAEYPLAEVDLRAPVLHPPAVRLFSGGDFAFGNPAAIHGPDQAVAVPAGAGELRYGIGLAAVVGADGGLGGWTLANHWTAPGLEPSAKTGDFALSIGPFVTTDEPTGTVSATVNGEPAGSRPASERWAELADLAARNTRLRPGDLLVVSPPGGPVARGDLVELAHPAVGVLRSRIF